MHEALRTDMRLMAEALTAVQTRLEAEGVLKAWQVIIRPSAQADRGCGRV